MNDTMTCDRCDEVNELATVQIVEHTDGSGEVVCKLCLADEYREEMARK